MPTIEEVESGQDYEFSSNRIYKMVSCSDYICYFVPYYYSSLIIDKIELGTQNKSERSLEGLMIKSVCVPIRFNRLGELEKR